MAGGSTFDPARLDAFRGSRQQAPEPQAGGGFDPSAFEALKAQRGAPAGAEAAPPSALESSAWDVGKTILPGLVRGANSVLGLPAGLMNLADEAWQQGTSRLLEATGALTLEQAEGIRQPIPGLEDRRMRGPFPSGEAINDLTNMGLRKVGAPELYKPKTVAGEVANSVAEFAAGGALTPGSVAQKVGQVIGPALLSEGAGQAARAFSPENEATARFIGGVAGGVGAGVAQMPRGGRAALQDAIRTAGPDRFDEAAALMERSGELPGGGAQISFDEALNKVTGGQATRTSQLSRVVANSGGEGQRIASEFYAARPGQVDAVGRAHFEDLAPNLSDPTALGEALQRSARAGVEQTPQGMALTEARSATGPRVTPEDAGLVMQPELRGVYDRREGMRAALGEREYDAARGAPERIGIERSVTVQRPGEPILQTLDNGEPMVPRYDAPPQGPSTLQSIAPRRPEFSEASAPRGPSLWNYMSENGGLGLERGDVKAAGLDRYRRPGVANLVREGAPSIDNHWRENLIEKGYLPPDRDGGMARNVHDEVLSLLEQEARGRRVYPYHWLDGDEASGFGRVSDEFQAASGTALRDVRTALEGAGVDVKGVHKDILDRAAAALVSGAERDPLTAFEGAVMAMREPVSRGPTFRMVPTTVTEEISAPRFGQVNPQGVVGHVEELMRSAKGPVLLALQQARKTLLEQDGRTPDLSVAGLHGAREAIGDLIEKGAPQTQRTLMSVRDRLDRALASVPEYERARAGYEAASRPLEAFDTAAPGAIVARDQKSGRMTMPPEKAPGAIDAGPSQARAFNDVATPAARQAYEGHLTTRLLDAATDGQGGLSAERLRTVMRESEDQLRQFPSVRERLGNVAIAREGLSAVERSPLGRVAGKPEVRTAIDALFPRGGELLAGSENEVRAAMQALVRNDPIAAQQLARIHLETVFDDAVREKRGLPAQYGGAGFASAVRGNPQQRKNLEAAFSVLPEGAVRVKALDNLLTTLEATGYRPQKGSDTVFNSRLETELAGGRSVGTAIANTLAGGAAGSAIGGHTGAASGGLIAIKRSASDAWTRFQIGRNGGEIARLLFDPKALPDLRALAKSKPGTKNADLFVARLIASTAPNLDKVTSDR